MDGQDWLAGQSKLLIGYLDLRLNWAFEKLLATVKVVKLFKDFFTAAWSLLDYWCLQAAVVTSLTRAFFLEDTFKTLLTT